MRDHAADVDERGDHVRERLVEPPETEAEFVLDLRGVAGSGNLESFPLSLMGRVPPPPRPPIPLLLHLHLLLLDSSAPTPLTELAELRSSARGLAAAAAAA